MKVEHNVETGTIIEVPLTEEEIQARDEYYASVKAEYETKRQQKQVILDRIGLTEEEAKLLLS
jgi:hypothetical protein